MSPRPGRIRGNRDTPNLAIPPQRGASRTDPWFVQNRLNELWETLKARLAKKKGKEERMMNRTANFNNLNRFPVWRTFAPSFYAAQDTDRRFCWTIQFASLHRPKTLFEEHRISRARNGVDLKNDTVCRQPADSTRGIGIKRCRHRSVAGTSVLYL